MLKYLNGTRNLELTLSAENFEVNSWYVDAAYAVHEDCKGQTGLLMTLGSGSVVSQKQKINAKNSTEAKLIGLDDAMPQVLWTRYFIEQQEYPVMDNIIMQDNISAMNLEKNGKASSFWTTKHLNVR